MATVNHHHKTETGRALTFERFEQMREGVNTVEVEGSGALTIQGVQDKLSRGDKGLWFQMQASSPEMICRIVPFAAHLLLPRLQTSLQGFDWLHLS